MRTQSACTARTTFRSLTLEFDLTDGQEAPTSDEVVSDVMSVMESALNELRALAS